ncbi:HET-domain-containing protein [Xylaria grammica]|nr:HET-domain-containing protein [Xylaria grammica]
MSPREIQLTAQKFKEAIREAVKQAEIERPSKEKQLQLFGAIQASDEPVVREIIASGVDVDILCWTTHSDHETPLGRAIRTSQQDGMLKLLIELGARQVDEHKLEDWILDALENGNLTQVALLLLKLTIQEIKSSRGLISAIKNNYLEAVRVFLDSGVSVDTEDLDATAPIIIAAENSNHEAAKFLLDYSPDLLLTNREGKGALDAAVDNDDEIMARLLIEHLPLKNDGRYSKALALDRAIRHKDCQMALSLIDHDQCAVSRGIKTSQLHSDGGQHPIIGPGNLYLRTLFETILNFQNEIQKTPRESNSTGSEKSFLDVLGWLLHCLTQHPACIRAEGPLPNLPSRVIDVGPPDGSQELVLRPGDGLQGRYIALTHRWGDSVTVKTTKKNLTERLKGMKFECLTKVMQDAVTVTRKLGIRYLWIDAICIIQDSHSDWSVEACDMARIYRNALLTIAAAVSAEHSDGFFTERNSGPVSQESTNEILDSRGWILQEQLLSPRILKYSKGQVDWECISLNTSEAHKLHTRRSATSSEIMRFKRAVCGLRSTSMTVQRQAHASWQHVVQSYSHRELTKESDKLMALMGIARFTGEITGDRFLAGLWKDQLWRDLLWKSDVSSNGGHLPPRVRNIKLPSWSWASAGGPVVYSWPAGSSPGFVESNLQLVSDTVDSDMSNGDVEGRLVINTRLRKVFPREHGSGRLFHKKGENIQPPASATAELAAAAKARTNFAGIMRSSLDRLKVRLLRDASMRDSVTDHVTRSSLPLVTDQNSIEGLKAPKTKDRSEVFWPDAADEYFTEAWLLPVASEKYFIHCLALVNIGDENVFKRVGLCTIDSMKSPYFFRNTDETVITLV